MPPLTHAEKLKSAAKDAIATRKGVIVVERRQMEAYLQTIRHRPWFREALEITWTADGVRINDHPCITTLVRLKRFVSSIRQRKA